MKGTTLPLLVCAALLTSCETEPLTRYGGQTDSLDDCLAMLQNTIHKETGSVPPMGRWRILSTEPTSVRGYIWAETLEGEFYCDLKQAGRSEWWELDHFIPDRRIISKNERTQEIGTDEPEIMTPPPPQPVDSISNPLDEIQNLYMEFELFKNDPEFRRVGFGTCCEYNQWFQRVKALPSDNPGAYLRSFGITPGELISLGREYYTGNGSGVAARMWKKAIQDRAKAGPVTEIEAPTLTEVSDESRNEGSTQVIGRWKNIYTNTIWADVTITESNGTIYYSAKFNDGSEQNSELMEVEAKPFESRRFKGPEGSSWGTDERVVIRTNGNLAYYDELGHIKTARPYR